MSTKYCPMCGGEFLDTSADCPNCEVELVDHPLATRAGAGGEVAYDLAEWSGEGRSLIRQLVAAGEIPSAWEGTTLVVPGAFEDQVDLLVDEAAATETNAIPADVDRVVYDLSDLADAEYSLLYEGLEQLGVSFELDHEGSLVVADADQEVVDELIGQVESDGTIGGFADATGLLDAGGGGGSDNGDDDGAGSESDTNDLFADVEIGTEEIDGPELMEALGDAFVACDRMSHDADDSGAVLKFAKAMDLLQRAALPFGFAASTWRRILGVTTSLLDDLETEEAVADSEVMEKAKVAREELRPLV